VRLAEPRARRGPQPWQLALLALSLLAAQLAWLPSGELERLASGLSSLADALRSTDPEAFRPLRLHLTLDPAARARIDDHVRRSLALGNIPHSEDDWVEGRLQLGGRHYKVEARLKGDFIDHIENGLSLRIKLRGGKRAWGMRGFSVQHPATRQYLREYAYVASALREGLLAPRHEFVSFALDDEEPRPYLLIEHTAREMLERERRREGVIVKFDESDLFGGKAEKRSRFGPAVALRDHPETAPLMLVEAGRVARSEELAEQGRIALERFEAFRSGRLAASETFDVERTARWLALSDLWGAQHALNWHNPRFYYDPVLGRFEPIVRDGNASPHWGSAYEEWYERFGAWVSKRFYQDPVLSRAYTRELRRLADPAHVEAMLDELAPELARRVPFLMDDPIFAGDSLRWTNFGWVAAQARFLREGLLRPPDARVEWQRRKDGGVALHVAPRTRLALELVGVRLADGRVARPARGPDDPDWALLPLPHHPSQGGGLRGARFDLPPGAPAPEAVLLRLAGAQGLGTRALPALRRSAEPTAPDDAAVQRALRLSGEVLALARPAPGPALPEGWQRREDDGLVWVEAPSGTHVLERDLVLPRAYGLRLGPGTTLRAAPGVALVVRGPVDFQGTAARPVVLTARDDVWQGLVVLEAGRPSRLSHVRFEKVAPRPGERGPRRLGWMQTGGVVFAESDLEARDVHFRGFATEDTLNVVRARVELADLVFEDAASDAFDGDFVEGSVERIALRDVGGDGVDVSGSRLSLRDVVAVNVADKAISVGEESRLSVEGLETRGGSFAIVAKDGSEVQARDLDVAETWVALAAYTKKAEFGPARLDAERLRLRGRSFTHLAQTGSHITLDARRLPVRSFDSDELYAR
jgi:hypothetical protein